MQKKFPNCDTSLADFCEKTQSFNHPLCVMMHRELQEKCVDMLGYKVELEADKEDFTKNCDVVHNPSKYFSDLMVSFLNKGCDFTQVMNCVDSAVGMLDVQNPGVQRAFKFANETSKIQKTKKKKSPNSVMTPPRPRLDAVEQKMIDDEMISAVKAGLPDRVKLLIEKGANVDAVYCNDDSGTAPWFKETRSALMLAASNYNTDTVKLLIENGANVNAANPRGETALMNAAGVFGSTDIVKLLIEEGANVNAVDCNGFTALMLAVSFYPISDNIDRVKLLIDNGAFINVKNKYGNTALSYVIDFKDSIYYCPKIEKFLRAAGAI